jgi:hypothetical protein
MITMAKNITTARIAKRTFFTVPPYSRILNPMFKTIIYIIAEISKLSSNCLNAKMFN